MPRGSPIGQRSAPADRSQQFDGVDVDGRARDVEVIQGLQVQPGLRSHAESPSKAQRNSAVMARRPWTISSMWLGGVPIAFAKWYSLTPNSSRISAKCSPAGREGVMALANANA